MRILLFSLFLFSFLCSFKNGKTSEHSNLFLADFSHLEKTPLSNNKENDNQLSILGKWVVTDAQLGEEMTKEEREEIIGKATIEFFADGKFEAVSETEVSKGTYSFDLKRNKLTIKTKEGETQVFSVSWTNDVMKLSNKEGWMTVKRIRK